MKILIVALALAGSGAAARAADTTLDSALPLTPNLRGQTVECAAFRHDADGSWTTLKSIPVQRENEFTTVGPGTVLKPGSQPIVGIDVVGTLDRVCPH